MVANSTVTTVVCRIQAVVHNILLRTTRYMFLLLSIRQQRWTTFWCEYINDIIDVELSEFIKFTVHIGTLGCVRRTSTYVVRMDVLEADMEWLCTQMFHISFQLNHFQVFDYFFRPFGNNLYHRHEAGQFHVFPFNQKEVTIGVGRTQDFLWFKSLQATRAHSIQLLFTMARQFWMSIANGLPHIMATNRTICQRFDSFQSSHEAAECIFSLAKLNSKIYWICLRSNVINYFHLPFGDSLSLLPSEMVFSDVFFRFWHESFDVVFFVWLEPCHAGRLGANWESNVSILTCVIFTDFFHHFVRRRQKTLLCRFCEICFSLDLRFE